MAGVALGSVTDVVNRRPLLAAIADFLFLVGHMVEFLRLHDLHFNLQTMPRPVSLRMWNSPLIANRVGSHTSGFAGSATDDAVSESCQRLPHPRQTAS